jgi:hypothetical protein
MRFPVYTIYTYTYRLPIFEISAMHLYIYISYISVYIYIEREGVYIHVFLHSNGIKVAPGALVRKGAD